MGFSFVVVLEPVTRRRVGHPGHPLTHFLHRLEIQILVVGVIGLLHDDCRPPRRSRFQVEPAVVSGPEETQRHDQKDTISAGRTASAFVATSRRLGARMIPMKMFQAM
jgi:hypothetical protein